MLVAVDTGGTKTLVTSFDKDGKIGEVFRFPTPTEPAAYVAKLRAFLKEKYGHEKVEAIVAAMPGIVKDGVALWCNNLHWTNFHARDALQGVLGNAPVIIENDANLAGLAEARSLKETPPFVLYVTVSTGIGTGIITQGKINSELRYSEGGRMPVEYRGLVREWETFASGQAIYKTYGKYARDITSKRTWDQIADRISRGFLAMIPILQPDLIIIGGSIGTYFGNYAVQLRKLLGQHLAAHIPAPRIIAAQHPEEAVLHGCYYYAIDTLPTF
jgi:predicted NBD/HSP70 family sugar kinase